MPKNKIVVYAIIFAAGVMLASRVRQLPVLDKLPTV